MVDFNTKIKTQEPICINVDFIYRFVFRDTRRTTVFVVKLIYIFPRIVYFHHIHRYVTLSYHCNLLRII